MEYRIIDYCIRKRLQWNQCFARKVSKEGEYYEEMMRYLRKNLAVCPEPGVFVNTITFLSNLCADSDLDMMVICGSCYPYSHFCKILSFFND